MKITAPYRYIPISKWIHAPEWKDRVAIDHPLEDGVSGWLDVTLTAHAPFLVGGNRQEVGQGRDKKSHVHFWTLEGKNDGKGTKAVPGSTLRGAMRSILEIATFGRAAMIADEHYPLRDLSGGVKEAYSKRVNWSALKAGWLFKGSDGRPYIRPVGDPEKIEVDDLVKIRTVEAGKNWDFQNFESTDRTTKEKTTTKIAPSLAYKYGIINSKSRDIFYPLIESKNKYLVITSKTDSRKRLPKTAQKIPGENNPRHVEFLFASPFANAPGEPVILNKSGGDIPVDRQFNEFRQISTVSDKDLRQKHGKNAARLPGWVFWKEFYDRCEPVPVFYIGTAVEAFGTASMFKLRHKMGTHGLLKNISKDHTDAKIRDIPTLIFGAATDAGDGNTHKGRVSFEPLVINKKVDDPNDANGKTALLAQPKASFFPLTVMQPTDGNGKLHGKEYASWTPVKKATDKSGKTSYDCDPLVQTPIPAGRARYPAAADYPPHNAPNRSDMISTLHPVGKGSTFKGRIRFHNIKPEELGALIWALTWGADDKLVHRIGMGKPIGYGDCTIAINSLMVEPNKLTDAERPEQLQVKPCPYLRAFVAHMETAWAEECLKPDAKVSGLWKDSEQIEMLLAMADPKGKSGDNPKTGFTADDLKTMPLNGPDGYTEAKKQLKVPEPNPKRKMTVPAFDPEIPQWVSK